MSRRASNVARVRVFWPTTALLVALLFSALLAGCLPIGAIELPPDVVFPKIEPVADAPAVAPAELAWTFERKDLRISVPIDAAVLAGARSAEKSALLFKEIERTEWLPDYYRAFIDEPHQESLYGALLAELRSTRDALGLDADRYAEMIIALVQSLEYRTDPVNLQPKFPIETVADADGDCDDKTLLAAALLAREGYDVAMLLFADEEHVALGLRTNGSTYGESGYALVEMTTPSLVGWVPESAGDAGELTSEPQVIRLGEGTQAYGAGEGTDRIRSTFDGAVARAEELVPRIEDSEAALTALAAEVEASRDELDRLLAAGRRREYNALVPAYNALVKEYNAAASAHNALVAEQNEAAETAQRILDGQTDRVGLVAWLESKG